MSLEAPIEMLDYVATPQCIVSPSVLKRQALEGMVADPAVKVKIEIASPAGGGVRPEGAVDRFIEATQETFESIASLIEESCQAFVERVGNMKGKPSECAIEFGVNAGGEGGVPFVAKGTLGANFKVTLKWTWSK